MVEHRKKSIKIRVSDSEYDALQALKVGSELATWMRETCLGKKSKRRNPPVGVDPDLLRQLAGIGNNLNQIARQVNFGTLAEGNTVQVLVQLDSIEQQLQALRGDYVS
jgi:ABC-type amino acid transport substrate-binding protein